MPLALAAFSTALGAAVSLFLAARWTAPLPPPRLAALALAALALWGTGLVTRGGGWGAGAAAVLLLAALLGSLLGRLLLGPRGIVSFCVAAALVDLLSSAAGPTARVSQAFRAGTSELLVFLSLSLPVEGEIRPLLGIGDLLVLTALYAALHRAGHRGPGAFAAPLSGLLLALAVGLLAGGAAAIPWIAATTVGYLLLAGRRARSARI